MIEALPRIRYENCTKYCCIDMIDTFDQSLQPNQLFLASQKLQLKTKSRIIILERLL